MKYFVSYFLDHSLKILDVKTAIQKGRILLFWIPFITMLSFFGIAIYFFKQDNLHFGIPIFVLGFVLPILYWGRASIYWKLWAFERVRNVHELEKKAIEGLIINRSNSFWNKTEIKTEEEKTRLEKLDEKFFVEDEFIEDYSIPQETYIQNNGKADKHMFYILGTVSLLMGCFVLEGSFNDQVTEKKTYFFLPIAVLFTIHYYRKYRKLKRKNKFIRLTAHGLETESHTTQSWNDLSDIEIHKNNLSYWYHNEETDEPDIAEIDLENFNCKPQDLEEAIKAYQFRSEQMG